MGRENVTNVAPEATKPIEDLLYEPGQPFRHVVASDCFRDDDPGDVLRLHARLADGSPLPRWMRFDMRHRTFSGVVPRDVSEELTVVVVASDVDGMEARAASGIRRLTSSGPESSSTRGFAGSLPKQGIAPCQQRDAVAIRQQVAPRPRER